MSRSIRVFIGEDRIVLQPCHKFRHKYGDDGRFCGSPVTCIAHSSTVSEILSAIDQTFSHCQDDAPQPTDLKAELVPLLQVTKEKTWHAITRSFAYISIREEDTDLIFSPLRPEKGAFLGVGKLWRSSSADRAGMASAFRAAAAVAIEEQNLHNPPPLS